MKPQTIIQQQQLRTAQSAAKPDQQIDDVAKLYVAPYTIYGSMVDTGLGPVEWWD